MEKTIFFVGGDYRIIKLAQMLRQDGFKIRTYGLEKSEEIFEYEKCKNIEDNIKDVDTIISSIPFSKDGTNIYMPFSEKTLKIEDFSKHIQGKTLIAGNIKNIEKSNNVQIYDLMKNEPLTIANAISTAEGALQIAMEETKITIHNSEILILGFGRIGKILAKDLQALGAKITCEARKQEDIAWIKAYGYKPLELNKLNNNSEILEKFDIIFNTIPHLILDQEKLQKVNKNCVIIDLASKPGGVDFEECNKLKIKNKWALALPGKVAPVTSAKYIKEQIYEIIERK